MKKRFTSGFLAAFCMLTSFNVAACSVVVGVFETDVDPGADGDPSGNGVDAGAGDVLCEGWAVQPSNFDPCSFVEPTGSLDLRDGSWRYDTATGILTSPSDVVSTPTTELRPQSGGDDIRVLSVTDLRIRPTASLLATGPYPLLILSFDGIRVEGLLSVASSGDGIGAGADSAPCGDLRGGSGSDDGAVGSGGGGGSFRSAGGDGGDGDNGIGDGASGGAGGTGGVVLSTFRGGCPGGSGGDGVGAGGEPGSGGGGLFLMARNFVGVQGQLSAGGQGASSTPAGGGGGGGGGSGGIIAINAEAVTIEAGGVVAANGGAGAQGSGLGSGKAGQDAQLSIQPARGGDDSSPYGAGGDGGALETPAGTDGDNGPNGSGGGGGGSVGEIIISAIELDVSTSSIASPPITVP